MSPARLLHRARSMLELALVIAASLAATACQRDLVGELPDAQPCEPSHIVYLNREPTTFTPGPGDSQANTSSIVEATVTTAGPSMAQATWLGAVDCVAGILAPFDIRVTDVDPGAVDHLEIAVTQESDEVVDLGPSTFASAVAPSGCEAPLITDIGFVFWGAFPADHEQSFCETFGWTVGIMAGLDTTIECNDMLSYDWSDNVAGCAPKSFHDEELQCGEYGTTRTCRCGGTTQNSMATMIEVFGPATCAP